MLLVSTTIVLENFDRMMADTGLTWPRGLVMAGDDEMKIK